MELKTCKRCGEVWCFHGSGRPLRCGKCKSPYWDRARRDEASGVKVEVEKEVIGSGVRGQADSVDRANRVLPKVRGRGEKSNSVTGLCPHGSEAKFCRIGTCAAGREK